MTNIFVEARPNIFLTAFFRSGSSHIKETLLRILPHYHQATTALSAGKIGNDNMCAISPFAAQVLFPHPETVFHQHTPGTSGNVSLLSQYGMRPIVQMRNILDSMLSVVELLRTGDQHIGIYYPSDFRDLTDSEQFRWAAANLPQWYFIFYRSWMEADIEKHIIWYDEYYKDQVTGMKKILDFTGHSQIGSIDDDDLSAWCHFVGPNSRLKFGQPGRGKEVFTGDLKDSIIKNAYSWGNGKSLVEELIER